MTTQIALLRGINVGKAKRISMADLRALVESLKCADVRTLLNSGNVVFKSSGKHIGAKLEKAIEKQCGFTSRVTILLADELREIVAGNPFEKLASDPSRYLVAVLNDPTDRSVLAKLAKKSWKPAALSIGARWGYLWCPEGILDSVLAGEVNRALKDKITARNWTTMLKLHAML